MIIDIPYAEKYMKLEVEDHRIAGVLRPAGLDGSNTERPGQETVRNALMNPIGTERVSDMAGKAGRVLVITSDHTRPVPSRTTLPEFLKELRLKNPGIQIKILVATGCHRSMTRVEMINKFGKDISNNEEIINHDSRDEKNMVYKGVLPSGGELWLNKLVDWADLVVSEGFIEPHFFAGFSGGRKSILPGIASSGTVYANHCSKFVASDDARAGKLENNPVHKDMVFAARAAKLKFILNVALDSNKRIIRAYAGHPENAHREGCDFVGRISEVRATEADIVVTSNGGYPLDQNIYQAVKGMTAAEACVKPGGVIIMVSSCSDGHGGEEFYRWFAYASGPDEVAKRISEIDQQNTVADQWQAQILARVLLKAKVIMVTGRNVASMVEEMHMLHAGNLDEAMEMATGFTGKNSKVVVIPDGVSVIVT